MLGFKIFDQDDDGRLNPLFNLCIKDNLCLEIALYKDKADSFIERMNNSDLYNSIPNKSIHLNYNKYLVNNIKEEKFYNNFQALLDKNDETAIMKRDRDLHFYNSNTLIMEKIKQFKIDKQIKRKERYETNESSEDNAS